AARGTPGTVEGASPGGVGGRSGARQPAPTRRGGRSGSRRRTGESGSSADEIRRLRAGGGRGRADAGRRGEGESRRARGGDVRRGVSREPEGVVALQQAVWLALASGPPLAGGAVRWRPR